MSRCLVLTAGFGEGHNAAARAVCAALREIGGEDAARVVDVFALARPRLNRWARRAYLHLINRAPGLWGKVYRFSDRRRPPGGGGVWLRRERAVLRSILESEAPASLVSAYPVYADLLARVPGRRPPLCTVVTDSLSIHSWWCGSPSELWCVPNPESAAVLAARGAPAGRIRVTGFPVDPFFAREGAVLAPPSLASGARPRVLHLVQSGTRGAEAIAQALIRREDWDVTLAAGRDDRLRRRLEQACAARSRPACVLGWTDRVPELLLTHHAVVGKAGGATTQEAIAACCPLVVTQIVPGQEEGNYELLRGRGVGGHAPDAAAVLRLLDLAFADGGALWARWRAALGPIARPGAAAEVARLAIGMGGGI